MNSSRNVQLTQKKRIGDFLVEAGLISPDQVQIVLRDQRVSQKRFGEILVDYGWVKQATIEYLMANVVEPEHKSSQVIPTRARLKNESSKGKSESNYLAISQIHLVPEQVARFLLFVILGLVLASIAGQVSKYILGHGNLKGLVPLFALDLEFNFPSLYATLTLLSCAVLLGAIATAKKQQGDRYGRHWRNLAFIFAFLSVDEAVSLHERTIKPLRAAFNLSGIFYFSWVLLGIAFVVILALTYWKFLWDLPKETRKLFAIAASLFLAGVIGMELIGGYFSDTYGEQNLTYAIITTLEETFEMLGVVVFIYALLAYLRNCVHTVQVQLHSPLPHAVMERKA